MDMFVKRPSNIAVLLRSPSTSPDYASASPPLLPVFT